VNKESQEVKMLFDKLYVQPKRSFPHFHQQLDASSQPGVYIIWNEGTVLHVGRTLRGRNGVHQPSIFLFIRVAVTAAEKPLSILTTVTPAAQLLSIVKSAAIPPKLAP